jgi:hypothetical protein
MRQGMRLIVVVVGVLLAVTGRAQFMYLDVDGDQLPTASDRFAMDVWTSVDVWLVSDRNVDDSVSQLLGDDGGMPAVGSYEFILRATGGTVEWGEYNNPIETMDVSFGEYSSETDFYTGFGGVGFLGAGRHHLGSIKVRPKSGKPSLEFAESSPVWGSAQTAFGSRAAGAEGDNTLRFGRSIGAPREPSRLRGDWGGSLGVLASGSVSMSASVAKATESRLFGVRAHPVPANPVAVLTVSTTRRGRIRVQLFDVRGSLVRRVADIAGAPPGDYPFTVVRTPDMAPLASGVLFYRVECDEGTVDGRLVILK